MSTRVVKKNASRGRPRRWQRLRTDRDGVAAVEFALVLPVMMLMYFGVVELAQGFTANRKLILLGRSLADLTTQATGNVYNGGSTTDPSDVTMIFGAAASVFYPFTNAKAAITSVRFAKPTTDPTIVHAYTAWSVIGPSGGTLRACGELPRTSASGANPPAVPDGLFVDQTSVIVADVSYTYLPLSGPTFKGIGNNGVGPGTVASIPMQQSTYMQPRSQTFIDWTTPTASKCAKPTAWPSSQTW